MTRLTRVAVDIVWILAAVFVFAGCAFAQFGNPATAQGSPEATQLPLSGRSGQNGSVRAAETPVPGTTTSVDTLNPAVQVQGPYSGSSTSTAKAPFSGKLSLREALERALRYNLGAVGLEQAVRQAEGISRVTRSALLPNLNGTVSETVETLNLKASGIRFNVSVPGFSIPAVVGPFNYMDARASLTQSIVDLTAVDNYRSSAEIVRSSKMSALDARDLVVLAVGGTYLQAIAARAREESARAQLGTANALYQQTLDERGVGLVAQIDVNQKRGRGIDGTAAAGLARKRSCEAEDQSRKTDRPAADRSVRTFR